MGRKSVYIENLPLTLAMWTTPASEEPDSFMVWGVSQNILEGVHPATYRGGGISRQKKLNVLYFSW